MWSGFFLLNSGMLVKYMMLYVGTNLGIMVSLQAKVDGI